MNHWGWRKSPRNVPEAPITTPTQFSQMGEALLQAFGGNARLLKGRYVKDLFKVVGEMEGGWGGRGRDVCSRPLAHIQKTSIHRGGGQQ